MQLVELRIHTAFKMNIFDRETISLGDYEDITTRSTRELVNDDGFHRVAMKGVIAKEDSYRTLFVKNLTEAVRQWVEFCAKRIS